MILFLEIAWWGRGGHAHASRFLHLSTQEFTRAAAGLKWYNGDRDGSCACTELVSLITSNAFFVKFNLAE